MTASFHHSTSLHLLPERSHRAHTLEIVLFAHPLIGRVGILAGEAKADEENRGAEDALEVADDGDRPALAGDHRLAVEGRGECATGRVEEWAVEIGPPGIATV